MSQAAAVVAKKKTKSTKFAQFPSVEAVESQLKWHVEFNQRQGRHAVANDNIEIGELLMIEHPVVNLPLARVAHLICHRCMTPLDVPQAEKAKAAQGNPCLPRYCPSCKEKAADEIKAQNAVAAVRFKIPEICTANTIDPTLLHFVLLLDLQRSGVLNSTEQVFKSRSKDQLVIRSSIADNAVMVNMWDKKGEDFRKKVAPALRALHKELKAVADAGALPNYQPASIQQYQADAAALSIHLHSIGPNDSGLALFPALSLFGQSCIPNCIFVAVGGLMHIRVVQPVKKGESLTVSYVNLLDPRELRQAALASDKHITCTCPRCTSPLEETLLDRLLCGAWCQYCLKDVTVPCKAGAENDAAAEEWGKLIDEIEEREATQRARLASKASKPGKAHAGKGKQQAITSSEDATATKTEAAEAEEPPAKDESGAIVAAPADGEEPTEDASKSEDQEDALVPATDLSKVAFWRCCNPTCRQVEPAHNVTATGPADLVAQAHKLYQNGVYCLQYTRHPSVAAQGEEMLNQVKDGMKGRLFPYHYRCLDAYTPLINYYIRKGDAMKVQSLAGSLYMAERELLGNIPSLNQQQCLDAYIDAVEHKVANSASAAIKKQFEKKLKVAQTERKLLKQKLYG